MAQLETQGIGCEDGEDPELAAPGADAVADASRLVEAVRRPYLHSMTPPQRSALVAWLSFGATFATVRLITYSIRAGHGPIRNVRIGGLHVHHYLDGIAMLMGVGAVAVRGDAAQRLHPIVGALYGSGSALVVDEFALLLDLRDVYWAREGRWSVDLALLTTSAVGAYFAGAPVWRALRREASKVATVRARRAWASAGGRPTGQDVLRYGPRQSKSSTTRDMPL